MKLRASLLAMAVGAAALLCACGGSGSRYSVSQLKGTYTIYANGFDSNFFPASVAGSITLDGKGNVTGGEQDFFDPNLTPNPTVLPQDPVIKGSITIGSDGRGTLTVQPTSAPPETFSFVQVNTDHLLITQFDSNATSSGSMDLQTMPSSAPTGGNAFALLDNSNFLSFGGVVNEQNGGNLVGEGDDDQTGTPNYDFQVVGNVSTPDSYGRGQITLYDATYGNQLQFAYYVVGPEAFRLIETDGDTTLYYLAGSMFGQGTAANAFSNGSLGGNFVFSESGPDIGINFVTAGQFVGDGAASNASFTSGVFDVNDTVDPPALAANISTAQYGIKSDGYGDIVLPANSSVLAYFGVYMVDPAINITDPNNKNGGGGALLTDLDNSSLGIGFAVPQVTASSLSGDFAFNQDGYFQSNSNDWGPEDTVGHVNITGSNATGMVDYNYVNAKSPGTNPSPDQKVTGSWATDNSNPGRMTAQLNVGSSGPYNLTFYQANDDLILHVDTDWDTTNNVGTAAAGVLEKQ